MAGYKDPAKHRDYNQAWRQANAERVREQGRERYARQPETKRCCSTRWYQTNREKMREWQRNYWLKNQYGITSEEYDELLSKQGGKCAICATPSKRLDVDHNHRTGKVRGLLCRHCNTALGLFRDSKTTLLCAATYLDGLPIVPVGEVD